MASRTLRIAINGWFWDRPETGSGQYVQRLVMTLAEQHPDVEWLLLVPRGTAGSKTSQAPQIVWSPHPVRRSRLGKVIWEQLTVPRAALRLGAHLLHVPYWASPAWSPVPCAVTILDLIPLLLPDYRGNLLVRVYTRLVSLTARRAALVLAISGAARDDIVHRLGIAPDAVRVTPLAADDRLSAAVSAAAVQERLGLPPGYVLYLGGFDVRKNLAPLFQAFAMVVRELPEARLVVAGRLPDADSAFTPDPRRLAREACLAEGMVTWLGFIPEADKALLYSGARLFVFPSQYEGFGLPPLEAMACGVPVVAAATSSLPEVIGPGGVLVDPLDVAALAAAITRMLTDADFHRERVMGARIQAGKFSWSQTAVATWAAYQSALLKG